MNKQKMKTKFMCVVAAAMLLGSQLNVMAQNEDVKPRRQRFTPEQLSEMQANRMVQTLMLDDETAAKFTPLYQDYQKELRESRQANRQAMTNGDNKQTPRKAMTDEEIGKMLKGRFDQSRKMLDIREKYYEKFSKILSQKQVMKIYQQENRTANRFGNRMNGQRGAQAKQLPNGFGQKRPLNGLRTEKRN